MTKMAATALQRFDRGSSMNEFKHGQALYRGKGEKWIVIRLLFVVDMCVFEGCPHSSFKVYANMGSLV